MHHILFSKKAIWRSLFGHTQLKSFVLLEFVTFKEKSLIIILDYIQVKSPMFVKFAGNNFEDKSSGITISEHIQGKIFMFVTHTTWNFA